MFSILFFCIYARAVKGMLWWENVARMQLHWQTTDVFRNISRPIGVPHSLRSALVISCMNLQKISEKEGQDIYPGNDDNEDAQSVTSL